MITLLTWCLLFIVSQSLVDHLADAGIEALELLILGSHVGCDGFRGEEAHQARQQAVDRTDDLGIRTVHAGRNPALQGLETWQNHLLSLET